MTKTLTEQYKFGEIKTGYYWCKIWGEDSLVIKWLVEDNEIHQSNLIEEVLAPVTDYDKVKEMSQKIERLEYDSEAQDQVIKCLQKQLEIATKALEEYADEENWRTATTTINTDYFEYKSSMYDLKDNGFEEAQKALKEMEGVK